MNKWTNEQTNERTNKRTNEWTNKQTNEQTNERMNKWWFCPKSLILQNFVCLSLGEQTRWQKLFDFFCLLQKLFDFFCLLQRLLQFLRVAIIWMRPGREYTMFWPSSTNLYVKGKVVINCPNQNAFVLTLQIFL